jgi:glycosyltransferase involved in cell wall biosynthesis
MNILLVSESFPGDRNGIGRVAENIQESLISVGVNVAVISSFKVRSFDGRFDIDSNTKLFDGSVISPFVGRSLFESLLIDLSPDKIILLCAQYWGSDYLIDMFKRGNTLHSVIFYSHGLSWLHTLPKNPIKYIKVRRYLQKLKESLIMFEKIIVLDLMLDDAHWMNEAGFDFDVLPNSASSDYFVPVDELDNSSTGMIGTCVGNMSSLKNQLTTLQTLINIDPLCIFYFIYPQDNKYSTMLIEYWSHHHDKCNNLKVFFIDNMNHKDQVSLVRNANFSIFSSLIEAQPIVVLECIAACVPYISLRVGCVEHLGGGVVCELSNFEDKVLRIISSHDLRKKLSNEALLVRNRYSIDTFKSGIVSIVGVGE